MKFFLDNKRRNNGLRFIATCLLLLMPPLANAGEIIVEPGGSLHDALRQAREWRRTGDARCEGGIIITVKAGRYYMSEPLFLRPEDSGTVTSPTIIRGEGTAERSSEKVRTVRTGSPSRSDWQSEPSKLGVRTVRTFSEDGDDAPSTVIFGDVCQQHTQLWPKEGMEQLLDFDPETRTITIPTPPVEVLERIPTAEQPDQQFEMVVHQRWAIAILRIKSFSVRGDSTVVTFMEPESRLEFDHPWPQPVVGHASQRASDVVGHASKRANNVVGHASKRANNVVGHASKRASNVVGHASKRASNVTLGSVTHYEPTATLGSVTHYENSSSLLRTTEQRQGIEQLVIIDGASHITFEGITFEHTCWNRPLLKGHVTLQGGFPLIDAYKLKEHEGLPWDENLENQAWIERPVSAVSVSHATEVAFNGCTFRQTGATALDFIDGTEDCSVTGCRFEDIGGTAIMAGSFAESPREVHRPYTDLAIRCYRLCIKGNSISRVGQEDWGAVAIGCGYVCNIDISGNSVSDCPYSGICVGWGWTPHDTGMTHNYIYNNKVERYACQLYDAGGIYTLSNQPGSTIRDNIISQPFPAPYATNDRAFCIYLDARTDGFIISGNTTTASTAVSGSPADTRPIRRNEIGDNHPGPNIVFP